MNNEFNIIKHTQVELKLKAKLKLYQYVLTINDLYRYS